MDELTALRDSFIWITQGEARKVHELHTSHIFNILKMIFNHVSVVHGWGTPVDMTRLVPLPEWFYHEPAYVGKVICMFAVELDLRGDLDPKHQEPLARIMKQLEGAGHHAYYNA